MFTRNDGNRHTWSVVGRRLGYSRNAAAGILIPERQATMYLWTSYLPPGRHAQLTGVGYRKDERVGSRAYRLGGRHDGATFVESS